MFSSSYLISYRSLPLFVGLLVRDLLRPTHFKNSPTGCLLRAAHLQLCTDVIWSSLYQQAGPSLLVTHFPEAATLHSVESILLDLSHTHAIINVLKKNRNRLILHVFSDSLSFPDLIYILASFHDP